MDFSKSLQELEQDDWGDPHGPTEMVKRCLRLRRVPLNQLSADDCRLLLGQQIGAPFLVPLALKFLENYLLEGGTMFPGALLANVLSQPPEFWRAHSSLLWDVREIVIEVEQLRQTIENLDPAMRAFEALEVK